LARDHVLRFRPSGPGALRLDTPMRAHMLFAACAAAGTHARAHPFCVHQTGLGTRERGRRTIGNRGLSRDSSQSVRYATRPTVATARRVGIWRPRESSEHRTTAGGPRLARPERPTACPLNHAKRRRPPRTHAPHERPRTCIRLPRPEKRRCRYLCRPTRLTRSKHLSASANPTPMAHASRHRYYRGCVGSSAVSHTIAPSHPAPAFCA